MHGANNINLRSFRKNALWRTAVCLEIDGILEWAHFHYRNDKTVYCINQETNFPVTT